MFNNHKQHSSRNSQLALTSKTSSRKDSSSKALSKIDSILTRIDHSSVAGQVLKLNENMGQELCDLLFSAVGAVEGSGFVHFFKDFKNTDLNSYFLKGDLDVNNSILLNFSYNDGRSDLNFMLETMKIPSNYQFVYDPNSHMVRLASSRVGFSDSVSVSIPITRQDMCDRAKSSITIDTKSPAAFNPNDKPNDRDGNIYISESIAPDAFVPALKSALPQSIIGSKRIKFNSISICSEIGTIVLDTNSKAIFMQAKYELENTVVYTCIGKKLELKSSKSRRAIRN